MYADENVIKIKHAVLREVAKLAFEGTLDAVSYTHLWKIRNSEMLEIRW